MAASISKTLVRNLKMLETDVIIDKSSFTRVGIVNSAKMTDDNVAAALNTMVDAIDNDLSYIRGLLDDAECGRLDEVFEFGILVDE